jgi:glycosyltransferase involved in cell wall biosynthesis
MNNIKLSIVIPSYNEEGNSIKLHKSIHKALHTKINYEVIWIDDGSTDGTYNQLLSIVKEDNHNKVISLMRNSGQSAALMAGFDSAKGQYIATIDGDMQNDPDDYLRMIEKLESENLDMVVGWRKDRWMGNPIRRIPSLLANYIIKKSFTNTEIHDAGCPVKLAKSNVIKNLSLYGELHRFLTYIAGEQGARIGEIEINHREREIGESKYGLGRTFKVIYDIINLKFLLMTKTTPIQFMGGLGTSLFVLGALTSLAVIILKIFFSFDMSGNPLTILSVLLFVLGVQFFMIGLLGELIVRTYYEGTGRKVYVIRDSQNL